MFYYCQNLHTLDLCNFTFNANIYSYMFSGCYDYLTVFVKDATNVNKLKNASTGKPTNCSITTHTHP